jgi:hypothetical protein
MPSLAPVTMAQEPLGPNEVSWEESIMRFAKTESESVRLFLE